MSTRVGESYDSPAEVGADIAARRAPVLVACDVDGTLAPIVTDPDAARLEAGAVDALEALSSLVDVAVVSGRPVADLRGQFGFGDDLVLVGSHGAEAGFSAAPSREELEQLERIATALEQVAATVPGAWVESKPVAAALHVRKVESPDASRAAVEAAREAVAAVPGARVHEGHEVLEVSIRRSTKASAVEVLRAQLGARSVVFVGDDAADEGVFSVLRGDDLGIRVGPGDTAAARRLRDPAAVVACLAAAAELLKA